MLLLCLLSCASETQRPVELPRNWDDSQLDLATRPVLAVVPFTVTDRVRAEADLRVAPMLTTALLKTGRFDVIENEKVQVVLEQQEFQQASYFDPEMKAKLGRMVGATAVLFGELTSATQQKIDKFAYDLIDTRVRIDVRAVDPTTGRIRFAESAEGRADARVVTDARGVIISGAVDTRSEFARAAAQAIERLGLKLSGMFPVMGFVVSYEQGRLVTDLGSAKDLVAGDELVVIRPVERLLHPVTGQPAGWRKSILGLARVESVELATSTARMIRVVETTIALQVGDRVVLRRDPN